MLDSLHGPYPKTSSRRTPEAQAAKRATKQPIVLSPRVQRIVVVAPTVVLSMWLSSLGLPLLPRVAVSIGVGAILILVVARHQRRRLS
jgi:hypothetical protein